MTTRHDDCSLAILVGGENRRFGGKPKEQALWGDTSVLEHLINRFSPLFAEVLVVGRREPPILSSLGTARFIEDESGPGGPLRGVCTALHRATTDWLWLVPGDAPSVHHDVFERLWRARVEGGVTLPRTAPDTKLNPVVALYHRNVRSKFEGMRLASDQGRGASLTGAAMAVTHAVVDLDTDESTSVRGFNSVAELDALKKTMNDRSG